VERAEIGLLKALATATATSLHYTRFVLGIGVVGVLLGVRRVLARPVPHAPVRRVLSLPVPAFPAEREVVPAGRLREPGFALDRRAWRRRGGRAPRRAMRPPAPPMFRRTALSRLGFIQRLDQPTRILLRQIARWPGRSFITAAGIAMSVAVLVTSMQWIDAINRMVDVYFLDAQAQDVSIGFGEPRSSEVERDIARLPGVMTTEPMRAVAAKMRAGSREEREAVQGLPANQELYRVYDAQGHELRLPPEGLVISTMLAKLLEVGIGDRITVEVLEGRRPVFEVPVVDTFETYIGSPAYMDIRALDRLMRERPSVTAVHVRVDDARRAQLFRELKNLPRVASVTVKDAAVQTFHETMAKTITIFISFFIVFSCALAFGVTYNAARISLSERGREPRRCACSGSRARRFLHPAGQWLFCSRSWCFRSLPFRL
jgi:putative ABC transport system permease protein